MLGGDLANTGVSIIVWSGSSTGASSMYSAYLDGYSQNWIDPCHMNGRSYCFPVRCVQELAVMLLSVFLFSTFASSDGDKSRVQRNCWGFLAV